MYTLNESRVPLNGDTGRELLEARGVISREPSKEYKAKLAEHADVYSEAVYGGSYSAFRKLRESITLGDFPTYFGDLLDRQVLGRYQTWSNRDLLNIAAIGTFSDFTRDKRRYQFYGGTQRLPRVGELGPYPERDVSLEYFEWGGEKYGADMSWSWESMLSDDLNGLRELPGILAGAAITTENVFVAELIADASGPHPGLYSVANGNLGTAALTRDSLEAAIAAMLNQQDDRTGEYLRVTPRYLVVPPELELTALRIQAETEVRTTDGTATTVAGTILPRYGLQVIVSPEVRSVMSTANGATSWFLFAEPNSSELGAGFPAITFERLRGMEQPVLLKRRAQFMSIGGGADPRGDLNERDAEQIRVVHAMGGARLRHYPTYASTGAA